MSDEVNTFSQADTRTKASKKKALSGRKRDVEIYQQKIASTAQGNTYYHISSTDFCNFPSCFETPKWSFGPRMFVCNRHADVIRSRQASKNEMKKWNLRPFNQK